MPVEYNLKQDSIGEYYDVDGVRRYLMCLKETDEKLAGFSGYSLGELPQSEWTEMSLLSPELRRILNQRSTSACVGHGAVGGFETLWKIKGGTPQLFSAFFIYGLINGGRDAGAYTSDSLKAMQEYGICTEAEVPGDGSVKFRRQFDERAFTVAKRFTLKLGEKVRSFSDMMSSVQFGFPVVFGIDLGRRFSPDGAGFVPDQYGGGGGHCMFALGTKKNSAGRWYADIQNSWGKSWGLAGSCFMPDSYFDNFDGFRIEVSEEDPQEVIVPPPAVE
jgi:hypothetical protein